MGFFTRFTDGLANIVSGAGTWADKRTHNRYVVTPLTPQEIDAAYRTSWLLRKVVDLPAFEMTRAGRDWQADKAQITALEAEEERHQLWPKLLHALILGRLGGGAIVLGVGNEDPALPINPNTLTKGSLRYANVFSRWQLALGPRVTDPQDDYFGQPSYFILTAGTGVQVRIHPSRVIAFKGRHVPDLGMSTWDSWFWGDSELQAIETAVKNADAAQGGFASLILEAKLDVFKIPGLTELAATADYEAALTTRMQTSNLFKSQFNALLIDAGNGQPGGGEEWETRQVTWAGIPDIIKTYLSIVAGASDIPATRLLGKSPDGMNATGDADEENFVKMIMAKQGAELKPALRQIDAVLIPSALGTSPGDVWWEFAPLDGLSETEEAVNFDKTMDAMTKAQNLHVIPDIAFVKGAQNLLVERGWVPGLEGALAELPEDERFGLDGGLEPEPVDPNAPPKRIAANDSAPRPLYVRRDVLNVADIAAWAKAQSITDLADDLHVTIAYSTTPVDWITMGSAWADYSGKGAGDMLITAGGPRVVEPLGGMTAVLMFASTDLSWRNREMREAGASWDYPDYQPHISLTKAPIDLANVQPYRGKIVLGPEIFEDIDNGDPEDEQRRPFGDGYNPGQPRDRTGRWMSSGVSRHAIANHVAASLRSHDHRSHDIGTAGAPSPQHVHGFARRIQSSAVRHTLGAHGDRVIEKARGQVPISKADFARIPQIVASAHTVTVHGSTSGRRAQSIEYVARIGAREYHYVEHVGTKRRQLTMKTMWKK